jgi:hydrogenase maturation protease
LTHTSRSSQGILLLGCGNPLRGDDSAGLRVVEAVHSRWTDRIAARLGQQLVPEWASDVAEADVVFIVDASHAKRSGLSLRRVTPRTDAAPLDGHVFGPQQLLGLAELVYGKRPEAYVLEVPGTDFEFCEALSAAASAGIESAILLLDRHIDLVLRRYAGVRARQRSYWSMLANDGVEDSGHE